MLRPASALKRQIRKVVRDVIPVQKGMLKTNLDDIIKQYEAEKPKLEDAERKRLLVREKITNKSNRIKEYVRREIKNYMTSMAKDIPDMINNYKTTAKITFLALNKNTKSQCQELVKELLSLLETDLSQRQQEWSRSILLPEIENQIKDMLKNLLNVF